MGLINRAAKLAALPVTTGSKYAAAASRAAITRTPGAQAALETTQNTIIEKITDTLADARGPAMKFGQTLATVAVALPAEQQQLLAPLAALYEDADARDWKDIQPLTAPLADVLTYIDPEPIAAASLGQVHAGVDTHGDTVAVKIQYPDAHAIVTADSVQLRALAPMIGMLAPNLKVGDIVKEHTARLRDELDYTREAHWVSAFAAVWNPAITIPNVIYASETLLVTTWVDGTSITDARCAETKTRDALATSTLTFAFASPTLLGATHADPHPGNYRAHGQQLGIVDFGSIAHPSGEFTRVLCDTLLASSALNNPAKQAEAEQLIARTWINAGMAPENINPATLIEAIDVRSDLVDGPVHLNSDWLQNAGSNWSDPASALDKLNNLRFPHEYLLEHRALGGALALAASLDATVDMREVIYDNASHAAQQLTD